ncbi:MAG: hypothetical protein KKC76_02145 [Proteobacteria bacterium]|nr:hypothetical protein [Pseudomonadota bacterium]MBU4298249.1 hypothetical protein [Pseudomonadota bacterium]MCG2747517.1 hypothetical protein [Desulfobulbaceae bacterium]
MSQTMQPPGDKMKKVLIWVSDILAEHPGKKRMDVFREAQVRFDLSPLECEFLDSHFAKEDIAKGRL